MRKTTSRRRTTTSPCFSKCARTSASYRGSYRGGGCAPGYNQINYAFEHKARSYRMLWDQTRGSCKGTRPTPATLKSFSNWINKGAFVWKVTNNQINKWCRTNYHYKTITGVKNALWNKFGKSTIKAVAFDKSGGFLVATAPTYKGKPFRWPAQ